MKMRNAPPLATFGDNYVNLAILRLKYGALKCVCIFIICNNELEKLSEMLISFYSVPLCDYSIAMSQRWYFGIFNFGREF